MGDSTTHVHEASTGAAYYDTVARLGNGQYAVWAAGMVGYGNFQEYLMLLKIYEEVRPESIACLDIRYELGLFHTIEGWLSPTEEERQVLERQGLDVLDRVVGETRRRYPEIRLIGLAVMVDSADDSAYEAIFRRHGAEY